MNYTDISGLNGADNMGGLKSIMYFIPYGDIDTIPEFKTTTGAGDTVTIDGNIVPATGKGFYELYTTLDTADLKAKITGERDSRGLEIELKCFTPGNTPAMAENVRRMKNDTFIVLVKDINSTTADPIIYQLGIKELPCEIFGEYSTGTLSKDRKGFDLTIKAFGNSMAYYEGTITMKP